MKTTDVSPCYSQHDRQRAGGFAGVPIRLRPFRAHCELGPALRSVFKNVRELRDGYEFEFPPEQATFRMVAEWAAGEHLCCPFFDIDLRQERGKGGFWMRLSGRSGVKQFIEVDLGSWMGK